MAIDADGCTQRAHDVWSTHPGYIGACQNQAKQAQAKGDHDAAIAALRQIGIPALAEQLVQEYKLRVKENQPPPPPPLVVTLTCAPVEGSNEYQLVCTDLGGNSVAEILVSGEAKYGSVKAALFVAIIKSSPGKKVKPHPVLTDGTVLGKEHDQTLIRKLFGLPPTQPSVSSEQPSLERSISPGYLKALLSSEALLSDACSKAFQKFDANGNGILELDEVQKLVMDMCKSLGVPAPPAQTVGSEFLSCTAPGNKRGLRKDAFPPFYRTLLELVKAQCD
eukprot:gnl/MRDRNA2_/MRDRNA2_241957_c0_seq1.p1 gnl/MRDRNA2_/MRDRNA2_241957_c0~~gnl/MRDRNA2_/MRDRNA2_241957_c0_seq1.p1  ORF type:complete len:325 (+),score=72.79 gnl/MRDRNA2_/MRDRNA2_241957_c0_seq1:142-975(+)